MKQTTQQVFNEAIQLPPIERAELVERIIESFDTEPDEAIRKAWESEAERRLADYKNGNAAAVSEDEVFYRIENDEKK
jgi:putative addiction module component (TIGR02574 family)